MDAAQYMQQCEEEDQAQLNDYTATQEASAATIDVNQQIGDGRSGYAQPQVFNISTNLIRGCSFPNCFDSNNLKSCDVCKCVQYCSAEHENADRSRHRYSCNKVKKAQFNFEKRESAILKRGGDDYFGSIKGYFWASWGSRDYIRARVVLVEALLKINTSQAVSRSLAHLLDLLKLCPEDYIGTRDVIPGLLIRLGRDLDAYAFCKWWILTLREGGWGRGANGTPYLATKDANAFEEVDFLENSISLSHIVSITLIKIRLMIDLQCLERAKKEAGPYVPRELLDTIRQHCTSSSITRDPNVLERDEHTAALVMLRSQVRDLYTVANQVNPHLWPALVNPGDDLNDQPQHYYFGDCDSMKLVLQYTYNAWAETPGAIGVIEELLKQCN